MKADPTTWAGDSEGRQAGTVSHCGRRDVLSIL